MAPPEPSKPPSIKSTTARTASGSDTAKVLALLESLHAKIDALPKCECNALRQEVSEIKKVLAKSTEQPPSPSVNDTYSAVKRAINDASTYADKAKRAVWVGRDECDSPEETSKSDQKAIEDLCQELNDPVISQALTNGEIQHHRHPLVKGDRKKRILKIAFSSEKTRDQFLSLTRSTRPATVSKAAGNFMRRDLCPFELQLERKARIEAFTLNCKHGALVYGVRDEKLIRFNGMTPRPLPHGYADRPPRGYENSDNGSPNINTSLLFETENEQSNASSILGSISPIQMKPTVTTTTTAKGAGTKA